MRNIRWLTLLLLACTPANADPRPKPPRPDALTMTAAGDTARGYTSWPAVRGATGYLVTASVTATNGTWTGLPVNLSQTARTASFLATSSAADSGTFVACVRAFNASDTTASGCTAPKTWRRKLIPPVPTWDSLTALLVVPDTVRLYLGQMRQVCGFAQFGNGAVARRTQDAAVCDTVYRRVFGPTTIALVSPSQQLVADGLCIGWVSSNPAVVSVTSDLCPAGSRYRFRVSIPVRIQAMPPWMAVGE